MDRRKAALWGAGTVAVIAAAGAIAFHTLLDPQRLIQAARDRVQAQWQRELRVDNVALRLFPVPSIHADRVALGNPEWAHERDLIHADRVTARLELLPLLVGQLRIKTLSLQGVKAALEEADDGTVSWELKRGGSTPAPQAAAGDSSPVQIAEIDIRDLSIRHRARQKDAEPWRIEEASLQVDPGPGLRNVRLAAKISRFRHELAIRARFDDLTRAGAEGATSEGNVELEWGRTKVAVTGRFPLHRALKGAALAGEAKSESFEDVLAFFGIERGRTAPLALKVAADESQGRITVKQLNASLGAVKLAGDAIVTMRDGKPAFTARLQAERIDWLQTLAQAGGTIRPPRNDGVVFHEDPFAWGAYAALGKLDGVAELQVKSLRMGNGLELANVRATAKLGNDRVELAPFATEMLGGSAKGTLRFDAKRKAINAQLDGENLLLERWFQERGRKIPFKGGPMKLKASLALAGATYRELAASVTGPIAIRMGRGSWESKRAGEVEEMMVSALAPQGSQNIELECVAANFDFRRGRAEGKRVLGARSTASQLLTSGYVDLRQEKLDLRGRVNARKGANLGLAALANGVQITGRLAKPGIGMDPDEKPAILARAAAAIATTGATLVGEALLNAASKEDPCEAVFK